jgi:DNA repair exonuclease SbcCD ATPase subunit
MSNTLFFNTLTLKNFLSFGNAPTEIDLSEPGTTSIEGQNLDCGGGNSNGSGKSSIINAICYALYNKPFDNISLQRLINSTNASKNTLMEVRLTFTRSGDEYEILRARGESYTIHLWRNGEDITPGKGVVECDKIIEEIIGISYELFTKTIIFSGNAPAFLNLSAAQQRNQIEELFNITLLSEKALLQKEKIKITEGDLKVQEAILVQQQVALDLHQKHIKEAELRAETWETVRTREIQNIQKTLTAIDTVDFELEQALHKEKIDLSQQGAFLAAQLAPVKKDKTQLTIEVSKLLKEQEHLAKAKCPYCLQQYADAPAKLLELETDIDTKGAKLIEVETVVEELNEKVLQQSSRLQEVQTSIKHPNLDELLSARENASVLRSKLAELGGTENPHLEAIELLSAESHGALDTDKVDALKRRLEHQAFLLKLLTSKDSFLRRRIINKTIPFLNSRINNYTAALGLPHIVKFDADLSCSVSEFSRELDFGNLSAGEKKRVNTGLALAFRDVLHHLHAKSNLLLIDELDGALDGSGIDAIVKILKEKSRDDNLSVFLISHHPNVRGRLDRTMTIQKQNGFSTILES